MKETDQIAELRRNLADARQRAETAEAKLAAAREVAGVGKPLPSQSRCAEMLVRVRNLLRAPAPAAEPTVAQQDEADHVKRAYAAEAEMRRSHAQVEQLLRQRDAAEAKLAAVAERAELWSQRAFGAPHMSELKCDTLEECAEEIRDLLRAPDADGKGGSSG